MSRALLIALLAATAGAADLAEGLRLKAAGRLPEAEVAFRAARAAAPGDADAVAQLATVVGWQGRHAEAEALWSEAVALRPADPDLWVGLARVRYWRGELEQAAAGLAAVLTAHPGHAEAAELAARVAAARGDHAQARELAAHAPAPAGLSWRGDLGLGGERYSAVHGDGRIADLGLAATRPGLGTLSAGAQRRWIDGGAETAWRLGLGSSPLPGVETEVGGSRSQDRILDPIATLSVDLSWRASPLLEPVAGWRRSWWPGDRTDLWRPGMRLYPLGGVPAWRGSSLEARALIADSPVSGTHRGVALRLAAVHRSGWGASLGFARADEAEPPRPPTRVVTWSLGAAWTGDDLGVRVDYEREDRHDDWVREGLSLGVWRRW